jgi:two-component system sensor histidine kinase YesM
MRQTLPSLSSYFKKYVNSFRHRIIFLFSLSTIIPFAILSYFSISFISNYIINDTKEELEKTTAQLNLEIDNIFNKSDALMGLANNLRAAQFLRCIEEDELYETSFNLNTVFKTIRDVEQIPEYVTDICIIGETKNCFSERNGYFVLEKDFLGYEAIARISQSSKKIHMLSKPIVTRNIKWEESSISLAKGIHRLGTSDINGVIQISLDKNYILDKINTYKVSDNNYVYLTDASGNIVFPTEPHNLPIHLINQINNSLYFNGSKGFLPFVNDQNEEFLIFYSTLSSTGWNIVSLIQSSEVLAPTQGILFSTILGLLVSLALIIFLNIIISSNIVLPIEKLSNLMKRAANKDLNIRIPTSNITEIASLYGSFQTMIHDTKQLMQDVIEEQKSQKKLALMLLQSQINPHFLYNTLEAIIWAASNGKTEQVVDLTVSLSRFYRMALSKGIDIVTLQQEINLVESYLTIMKMQYYDLFDYKIDISHDISQVLFPKMVLQPLVENCLYHGIQKKRMSDKEKGSIKILAYSVQNTLIVEVEDNGAGLDEETLSELVESLNISEMSSQDGYGLKNINQRIKLYFGNSYGLRINSTVGRGTTVEIIIPLQFERGVENEI